MATIVRLDKIDAAYDGPLESVQHTADMNNGSVINLGALVSGERELRAVSVPATATLGTAEVLLVASPEIMYGPVQSLKDFVNVANKPARAYHLRVGDIFTVTDDGITGSTTVGQFVIPANGSLKLAASATDDGSTRFAGLVLKKTTLGFDASAATVIQVVRV